MIYYHFTSHYHIEAIRKEGLTRGEVSITPNYCLNAVWLTTDRDPRGHGLTSGEEASPELVKRFRLQPGTRWLNKRAIRITVKWPASKVTPWLPYARKRLDPHWLQTLTETGGGSVKAKTWYLSFEPIPASALLAIDILAPPEAEELKGSE